ncbi:MAG TPA: serine/threonine-protein kinase [Polyangiaceae bacterium]|nr:serine/threonine-protein kinase [Polyangiaceae bacterium]
MTNKPASIVTELDLPPLSEGTPPLPLARPAIRSGVTQLGPGVVAVAPVDEAKMAEFIQRTTLHAGDIVADRYRVGPAIGAGGMGVVYKAQHIELGTWVAIKVIRPDIAQNSSLWRRFAREARALAALHNKHVVRVHDAGTLPSGLRYLVMELLDGTDLRRWLSEYGMMPVPEAVDYALQVCSALGDAHRLHIIHRDIKPENIFLARFRASEPTIKLLDFGVARFLDDAGQLTVPARGMGSPRYLSPEQLQNPGSADQRSDLWGVGLLLYELISGLSPFHEMNTAQVCLTIVQGPIPSIDIRCPNLPPALSAAIMRCLEIDPARRFQSADELIAALEPFSSRHIGARPPTRPNATRPSDAEPSSPDEAKKAKRPWSGLVPRWLCGAHAS